MLIGNPDMLLFQVLFSTLCPTCLFTRWQYNSTHSWAVSKKAALKEYLHIAQVELLKF